MGDAPILAYGAGRRWWPARHPWVTAALLVAGLIGAAVYLWGGAARTRAEQWYWYRQCLRVPTTLPSVLVERDEAKWPALDAQPDFTLAYMSQGLTDYGAVVYTPRAWRELAALCGEPLLYTSRPRGNSPVIFCGRLIRPDGQQRLVVLGNPDRPVNPNRWISAVLVTPPTLLEPARLQDLDIPRPAAFPAAQRWRMDDRTIAVQSD